MNTTRLCSFEGGEEVVATYFERRKELWLNSLDEYRTDPSQFVRSALPESLQPR
jgi:hypothetical protein